MFFWKISIPYSRFSRIRKTDLKDLPAHAYSSNASISNFLDSGLSICRTRLWIFIRNILSTLGDPKSLVMVDGVMDISTSPNNYKNENIFLRFFESESQKILAPHES